jgi:Fe-S-cluster containining protein
VHYLYQNETVLKQFLQNFTCWNERILHIENTFNTLNTLQSSIIIKKPSLDELHEFEESCNLYTKANLNCPFLIDNSCSIYNIRPYICASIISIAPAEWCKYEHPSQKEAILIKTPLQLENDLPYFLSYFGNGIFSNMPLLVYRILVEGYDALSSLPVLENTKDLRLSDFEVKAVLRSI